MERLRIEYGTGSVEVEPGTSVLAASIEAEVPHAHACGGRARCTTCRVVVEMGLEHCPPPDTREAEALSANGLAPPVRLACQLRPTGDVRVRVLIPSHDAPGRGRGPEAAEEQVAVLFADLRGFTGFAEAHLPFDVCNVLNRYFDTMGVIVERNGGRILDYLGDGVMTLFRDEGDRGAALRAGRCAGEMREAARSFSAWVGEHFQTDLSVGIAVHSGRAVVGQLGYFRERHLNAVGDTLNVVARLEAFNTECGTDILVSSEVAQACADALELGRSFAMRVKGRAAPIEAFEVLGAKTPART